jgi:hypothetical protein
MDAPVVGFWGADEQAAATHSANVSSAGEKKRMGALVVGEGNGRREKVARARAFDERGG